MNDFRFKSAKGHRADPFAYPMGFERGDIPASGRACAECGFDLESEARGRFRHLDSRNGAAWMNRQAGR